jgi:DNA modification methylase
VAKKAVQLPFPHWRDRIVSFERIAARDLQAHDGNWRTHPQTQQDALRGVLDEVGIAGALLVYRSPAHDGAYVTIDGHLRTGLDPAQTWPCLVLDVDDAEAAMLLATHDPLAALAEADTDRLRALLDTVQSSAPAVQAMLSQLAEAAGIVPYMGSAGGGMVEEGPPPEIDRADELRQKWGTAVGQLWQVGRHRLLCGDCTDKPLVNMLLGEAVPLLMVTDPPYGVEYDANWRNDAAEKGLIAHAARRVGKVVADDRSDWREAWQHFPGDVVYCWHASWYISAAQHSLEATGFEIRNLLIWAKPRFSISRGHYHWQHEPCWYAVRTGATAHWIGDRSQTTLWTISLDPNADGGHSTQKPVECMVRPIKNHAGDVYDPFLGSGTTLIACEQLGRCCYAMEIDAGYVAVALERWRQFTGQMPILLTG